MFHPARCRIANKNFAIFSGSPSAASFPCPSPQAADCLQLLHLRVALFVDDSVRSFHGNQTERYARALMQMTALLFQDASIGLPLELTLVRLEVLKKNEVRNCYNCFSFKQLSGRSASLKKDDRRAIFTAREKIVIEK